MKPTEAKTHSTPSPAESESLIQQMMNKYPEASEASDARSLLEQVLHQSPETRFLFDKLVKLNERAKVLGADGIRDKITSVVDDLSLSAGKDNARMAIGEIGVELSDLERPSERRVKTPKGLSAELDFDDLNDEVA